MVVYTWSMQGTWRSWLPAEHGVWGLIAAAALVGLPLGGDLAGLPLICAAVVAVLLRARCLKGVVVWPCVASLVVMLACAWLTWVMAEGRPWQGWAAASALVALLPPLFPRRSAWSSVVAGAAFALLAAGVAVAGGASSAWATVAAVVLAVHLGLMVPLVRAQVRPGPRWGRLAVGSHAVATCLAAGLWAVGLVSSVIPLVFVLGLARCLLLVDKRTTMSASPARIGAREMAWLPVVAGGLVLALRGGW